MNLKKKWLYIVLIIISLTVIYMAYQFPKSARAVKNLGPSFFPIIVSVLIILLSSAILFSKKEVVEEEIVTDKKRLSLVIAIFLGAIIVIQYVSFMTGVFAFLLCYLYFIAKVNIKKSLIISVAGTAVIVVPVILLKIPL